MLVAPAWIGDVVMAHSVVRYLRQQHPVERLDVVCAPTVAAVVARMPGVDHVMPLAVAHGELGLYKRFICGRALRGARYDWALTLPNSWKSALTPLFARAPRRTGYVGEMRYGLLNDLRHLDRQALPRMVDRYLALAVERGAPLPSAPEPQLRADPATARQCLERLGVPSRDTPVLALCPGAEFGSAKRWPAAHFAEIARAGLARGFQVWLLGGPTDRSMAGDIDARTGGACVNLAGRTRLDEALDVLALAHAVVTNDSGLMHVAAALGRPVVALFGSSDPDHTPPLSAHARALSLKLSCSPCFARECPLGHRRCLEDLRPQQALEALASLLPEVWGP